MGAFFRFLVWTAFCIGLGIFAATYSVGGETPWEKAQKHWQNSDTRFGVERVKNSIQSFADDDRASARRAPPQEHHSVEERAAIERLIAKKAVTR